MSEKPTIDDALAKLREQLAWRGPKGGKMGNIVLKRDLAEAIASYFDDTDEFRASLGGR